MGVCRVERQAGRPAFRHSGVAGKGGAELRLALNIPEAMTVPPWNSTVSGSSPLPETPAGIRVMLSWPMKVATNLVAG